MRPSAISTCGSRFGDVEHDAPRDAQIAHDLRERDDAAGGRRLIEELEFAKSSYGKISKKMRGRPVAVAGRHREHAFEDDAKVRPIRTFGDDGLPAPNRVQARVAPQARRALPR